MIPSPLKAANVKIATLTILLQEARDVMKAMFLLLMRSDKMEETPEKFERLTIKINSALKTGTDR